MRSIFFVVVIFCLIIVSCEDENDNEIIIKVGRECGWCGGADSLAITRYSSEYIFKNACNEPPPGEKRMKTNSAEWNELLATLNWDTFKKVNVNTCALCADGCDTWIYIKNENETHSD